MTIVGAPVMAAPVYRPAVIHQPSFSITTSLANMVQMMGKPIDQLCTVYVGKIPPGYEDEFVRKLLEVPEQSVWLESFPFTLPQKKILKTQSNVERFRTGGASQILFQES